jgi:hypothetical protein
MSDRNRDLIIDEVNRALIHAVRSIEVFSLAFRNPKYDLKKIVDNDIDFILGGVINDLFLTNRNIRLTPEEIDKLNVYVFSNAGKLKDGIRNILDT